MVQLVNGVRSKNNNIFIYSSYWGCWSRILQEATPHNDGNYIEVNLTAINPTYEHSWKEQIEMIRIRRHGTSRDKKDRFVGTLPQEVVDMMLRYLAPELVERLLHEDFLPHIDWNLYRKHCNGGAPFEKIRIGASQ